MPQSLTAALQIFKNDNVVVIDSSIVIFFLNDNAVVNDCDINLKKLYCRSQ